MLRRRPRPVLPRRWALVSHRSAWPVRLYADQLAPGICAPDARASTFSQAASKAAMTSKADEKRKPGVRVDGGTRRDMNADRVAGRMAALPENAPTPEQTKARRAAAAKRERTER